MSFMKRGLIISFFLFLLFLCLKPAEAVEREEVFRSNWNPRLFRAEEYANQMLGTQKEKFAAPKRKKPWSVFGSFGYDYDDNVLLVSSRKSFRPPGSVDTSANRFSLSSGLSYLLHQSSRNELGVSYSYFHDFHDDSLNEFNFQNHALSVFACHRGLLKGQPSEICLRYNFDHGLLGGDTFSSSNFWVGSWMWEWRDNLPLVIYEKLGAINFRDKGFDESISSRDAFYERSGFLQSFLFDRRRRSVGVGYEFGLDAAKGRNFDVLSNGARVVLHTPLIEKIELDSAFYFQVEDYRHFAVSPKRFDLRYQYEFRLSRPLGKHWRISGFYRRLDVHDTHNSTLGQFSYERNLYGTELSFRY